MSSITNSQYHLRAQLESMVIKDLLGPAGGDHEEITERTVRDRYLLGILAPSRRAVESKNNSKAAEESEEDDETPLLPDELSEGGSGSIEDGTTDTDTPVAQAFFPSSIGLTFCVELDVKAIEVVVSWGHYQRDVLENQTDHKGNALKVWKRTPRGGTLEIPLEIGEFNGLYPDAEFPDVIVRGTVRKRDSHFVVTLFLVNDQEERKPKDPCYLFQPQVVIRDPDGKSIFCKRITVNNAEDLEDRITAMLYRNQVEFAVGHGVSVHAEVSSEDPSRATRVETTLIPTYEVPKSDSPSSEDAEENKAFALLEGLVLDMKVLSESDPKRIQKQLGPLVSAYRVWIADQESKLSDPAQGLAPYGDASSVVIFNCKQTLSRIEAGLQLLAKDAKAFDAFFFMNRAMWLQRTHSILSEQVSRGDQPNFDLEIDIPKNRSWRPFQIAFILINLPGVSDLSHPDRGISENAQADLLFFPTGGGKTEAYLGLSAYTMALRRLQGIVAGRDGSEGVAVLMRYTLRLLTIQQFQRATALLCACEWIRRKALEEGDSRWGKRPFRIGLWVGRKTTPNRIDQAIEAISQARGNQYSGGGVGSPYQLTTCPWCGSGIEEGKHLEGHPYPGGLARVVTYCGDKYGNCPFSKRQANNEGLPISVVDEEIYRRLPSMLIATVDKFAQMPWKGEVQTLFGQITGYCDRHGFKSPEIEDASSHPKSKQGFPAVQTREHPLLRPPDLIIQDELHLISGPLGSLVGLYETAIDKLCTWEVQGKQVRPKVIASTATIKNAEVQVRSLFLRTVNIFPPPGLDIRDNFFSIQRKVDQDNYGRRYMGIMAPGRRLKAALIRVYVAYLCAAQSLYETHEKSVDPWMTLVGYFNSMRELGGMRRLIDDAITSQCNKQDRRGLGKRKLWPDNITELTSRMRSEEIRPTLDRLECGFDPEKERQQKEAKQKRDYSKRTKQPIDILLATNMISVGVDIKRLGLMVVTGQPKATAEYIQATSRVGRTFPGIVCTVLNWARPRDLSHYETFEHYHSAFYKHVEPLSVTPFSPGALKRGLAGLLVSLVRLRSSEFNPNESACRITTSNPYVQEAIEAIVSRASIIGDAKETGDYCRKQLLKKADEWQHRAQNTIGGAVLTYTEPHGKGGLAKGTTVELLSQASGDWEEFTCLNSLRDVEPQVKFIISDGGLDDYGDKSAPQVDPSVESNGEPS